MCMGGGGAGIVVFEVFVEIQFVGGSGWGVSEGVRFGMSGWM